MSDGFSGFIETLRERRILRVAGAYFFVAWALIESSSTIFPVMLGENVNSDAVVRVLVWIAAIGFPLVMLATWHLQRPKTSAVSIDSNNATAPPRRKLDVALIIALSIAVLALLFDKFAMRSDQPEATVASDTTEPAVTQSASLNATPSIAILPFENLSTDPANEIFGDGLAEEVLNRLSRLEGLRVAARSSSFQFRHTSDERNLGLIGERLSVNHVLEGSVRAAGNQIRVTARLIGIDNSQLLWSENYERQMTDIFSIQDEIADSVADNLSVKLLGDDLADRTRPTENLDAYRLYLQGRSVWHRRTAEDNATAIRLFEESIALDPDFAEAWSGLADAYNFASSYGNMPIAESAKKSMEAALKSLELNPLLAEAHASMGLALSDVFEFEEAIGHYERAIELNPNYAMAHMWLGNAVSWVSADDALANHQKARELNPLSPIANHKVADSLLTLNRLDEARAELLKITEFAPDYPGAFRQLAQLDLDALDYASSVRRFEQALALDPQSASTMSSLSSIFLALGDTDKAQQWMDKAKQAGPQQFVVLVNQYQILVLNRRFDEAGEFVQTNFVEPGVPISDSFVGSLAYFKEDYATAAERFEMALLPLIDSPARLVNEQTIFGVIYWADSLKKSGNHNRGDELLSQIMAFLDNKMKSNPSSQLRLNKAQAFAAMQDYEQASRVLSRLAEDGWASYLKVVSEPIFNEIRNEPSYDFIVETMKSNATKQLALIDDASTS